MSPVKSEIQDKVLIITLTSCITNPINLATTQALNEELKKASDNYAEISGLVLTSENDKFFSIGFDIPKLLEYDEDSLAAFYDSFNELCLSIYSITQPTISALTGHYVGAGCILAACTDYRLLANSYAKTGITAVKFGLPVPILADMIVRQHLDDEFANLLLGTGELFNSTWAQNAGFIDEIIPNESLLSSAIMFLQDNINSDEYNKTKKRKIASIVQTYLENRSSDKIKFMSRWFSEPVQKELRKATNKF